MSDGVDWQAVIMPVLEHTWEQIHERLTKFRDRLDTWLNGMLAGPIPDNWREELARFVQETQQGGLDIEPEGIKALEGIIRSRVELNSRQTTALSAPHGKTSPVYGPEVPSYLLREWSQREKTTAPSSDVWGGNKEPIPVEAEVAYLRNREQVRWQEQVAIMNRELLEAKAKGHHGRAAQQALKGVDLDVVAPLPKPHLDDLWLEPLTGHTHDDFVLAAAKIASTAAGYDIALSDKEILDHPGRWGFDAGVSAADDPLTYAALVAKAWTRLPEALRVLRAAQRAPSRRSLGFARRIARQADVEFLPYANRGLYIKQGQAHHLNPSEILGGFIRYEDGITTSLAGDAFRDVGSEHFISHRGTEAFFDMYRTATNENATYPITEGWLFSGKPSFSQYNRALYNTLQEAGVDPKNALRMVMEAKAEQIRAGARGPDILRDLPRRMGQRGGP